MDEIVLMRNQSATLADLLCQLLSLPDGVPVFATPSFRHWLPANGPPQWPPADTVDGLWLVDTRDRGGRELLRAWKSGTARPEFGAALILSGSGAPGSLTRRLLRRIRRPGMRRLPEDRVRALLPSAPEFNRLTFTDGPEVPAGFGVDNKARSTGAAFLLTRTPPFAGSLWSLIGDRLRDPELRVLEIQLRIRGAAILMVRARGQRFVVRVVPAGRLQEVVLRNHSSLTRLRGVLAGQAELLRLLPEPIFADTYGPAAVLGETQLDGVLAWQVASGERASAIYRNSIAFLHALKGATAHRGPIGPCSRGSVDGLLAGDVKRLEEAAFVDRTVRQRINEELRKAAELLEGKELMLHMSHGDFGYGNILVEQNSGEVTGIIDWDTARAVDFPGIDRVNLEIQIRRSILRESFAKAVQEVWRSRAAHDALVEQSTIGAARALFGLGVTRYILRSIRYPAVYRKDAAEFERALAWLARTNL